MTFRELSQVEIWSKRTSRKIFVAFGVVAIAFAFLHEIDDRWTTPKERKAAREALSQLDALQALTGGDKAYGNTHQSAKQKVDVAFHSGLTSKDQAIAQTLSMYLMSIESDNERRRSDDAVSAKWGGSKDPQIQEMLVRSQSPQTWKSIEALVSRNLHSVID